MISEKDRQSIDTLRGMITNIRKLVVDAEDIIRMAEQFIEVLETDNSEEYITPSEAATELGLVKSTVIAQIKKGNIKAHRVEREYRIAKSEIQRIKEGRITD